MSIVININKGKIKDREGIPNFGETFTGSNTKKGNCLAINERKFAFWLENKDLEIVEIHPEEVDVEVVDIEIEDVEVDYTEVDVSEISPEEVDLELIEDIPEGILFNSTDYEFYVDAKPDFFNGQDVHTPN